MANQYTETETDLNPDEVARLLAAARRAHEDAVAGRVYRLGEADLLALAGAAETAGRPLTREEVDAWARRRVAEGSIEALPGVPLTSAAESSGP